MLCSLARVGLAAPLAISLPGRTGVDLERLAGQCHGDGPGLYL